MKKICLFILFGMCFLVMKAQVTSGSNDWMSWEFSEDGVLTIGVNENGPNYYGQVWADLDRTEFAWDDYNNGDWYPWHSYRSKIKTIVIEEGISSIDDSAFSGCENLTSVNLPSSLCYIGGSAFYGCSKIKSLYIPESVTFIKGQAFSCCKELETINLPSGLLEDEYNNLECLFSSCINLKSIDIPDSIRVIGDSMFFGCESLESASISNNVTKIDDHAFSCCFRLTSFTFPDSLEYIGDDAFMNCILLPAINIGKKLTHIGEDAFLGTNNLSSIEVDEENKIFDSRQNCNAIIKTETNELILGCNNTIIPNTVTSIGKRAFSF